MRGFEQRAGIPLRVTGAKNGIPGNQKLRSCFDDHGDGIVCDPTIHFNPITQTQFLAKFFETLNLLEGVWNKTLPAETGIHAHDENMMDHAKHRNEQVDGGGWVDDHSGLQAVVRDEFQRAMQMAAGLVMHAHPVGAGLGECLNELVRIFDHHVTVERQIGDAAQRLDDGRAQGKVGHKMAVHDIDMDNGPATSLGGLHLFAQSREVGGKYGWKQLYQDATSLSRY